MRDFQYNEEEMKADKEEMTRLSTDKKKQFVRLLFSTFTVPLTLKYYSKILIECTVSTGSFDHELVPDYIFTS